MKKERVDILFDLYRDAKDNNSLNVGTNFNVEDLACGGFDLEYLEDGEFIRIEEGNPDEGWDVYITYKGVDVVEKNLEKNGFYINSKK
jgi:hypothetical protein